MIATILFFAVFTFAIALLHYVSLWQSFGNASLFLKLLPLLLSCVLMFLLGIVRSYQGFGAVFLFFLTYIWLGGIFFWFCTSLVFLLLKICHINLPSYFACLIALVLTAVSVWNAAKDPIVTHIKIDNNKITKPLLIAQISDIHLGKNIKPERLKKVVEAVNSNKPDLIVLTGDIFEEQKKVQPFVDILKTLNAPCGKYVISGNHEYYGGLAQNKNLFRQSDLVDLDNKTTETCGIILSGVSDKPDKQFLDNLKKEEKFSILLQHQPNNFEELSPKIDLMLSGHAHAGQIWPFTYLVALRYKHFRGFYTYGESSLYVNQGTFYWGPPMRLFTNNEITLIELNEK